ncbi:nucleotidyltransferase family protein [Jiella flava]|uniref:nucleotidyltransferase family protein n=1 Tax=Jiella flava TaxID=2816857 RepID=UPI0031B7FAA5
MPAFFGSVARGEDTEESDLDIIVEAAGEFSLFDLARLEEKLSSKSQTRIEVRTDGDFSDPVFRRISPSFRPL